MLNAALRDLKDVPTIKDQTDPIKYLEEELLVTWQDGSEVIRITFKGHEPQDAKRIVDAVQKAFMSEVIQKDVADKQQFLKTVQEAELATKNDLKQFMPTKTDHGGGGARGRPRAPQRPRGRACCRKTSSTASVQALVRALTSSSRRSDRATPTDHRRPQVAARRTQRYPEEAEGKRPIPQITQDAVDRDQEVIVEKLKTIQAKFNYEKWKNAQATRITRRPRVSRIQSRIRTAGERVAAGAAGEDREARRVQPTPRREADRDRTGRAAPRH